MDARWGRVLSCLNSDPDLLVILYALPDDILHRPKQKFASLIYYLVVFQRTLIKPLMTIFYHEIILIFSKHCLSTRPVLGAGVVKSLSFLLSGVVSLSV